MAAAVVSLSGRGHLSWGRNRRHTLFLRYARRKAVIAHTRRTSRSTINIFPLPAPSPARMRAVARTEGAEELHLHAQMARHEPAGIALLPFRRGGCSATCRQIGEWSLHTRDGDAEGLSTPPPARTLLGNAGLFGTRCLQFRRVRCVFSEGEAEGARSVPR